MSRKAHDVDPETTDNCGFSDSRSYVTMAGKVYRFGDDMSNARMERYNLDKGYCQICKKGVKVSDFHLDHYPISRGRGGDDSLSNLRITHPRCHLSRHVQVKLRNVG